MAWNNKVPFQGKTMMEYVPWRPSDDPDETITWRDNDTFEARLIYQQYSKGRSSVRFYFVDEKTNIQYSMSISAFDDIVRNLCDGKVFGKWKFEKKGENYGLVCVEYYV